MDTNGASPAQDDSQTQSSPGQQVPLGSPNKEHLIDETMEEFSKFCCLRSIPKDVKQRASHYLQEFTQQRLISLLPETKNLFALIIYLAVIETRLPYGPSDPHIKQVALDSPSISVTDILQMTGVNINELFHTLNVMKEKTDLPGDVIAHLKKLEKNYCVVAALFNTFESRLCQSVFRDIKANGEEEGLLPPIPETEGVSFRKKQCWTLFLLSRHHLLRDNPELFPHFQLLLCCVEFVLRQTPSFLLNSPYDTIRFGCFSTQEAGRTMLEQLAQDFQVASDGTLQLHLERTEPFFQKLLNNDGQLDSDSICEEYEKIYHKEGDLDELQFLTHESHLMPMPLNKVCNPPASQAKLHPGQMTPVRQAVSSVELLHKNFGAGPERPTDKLSQYFKKCLQDPTSKIQGIMKKSKGQFVKAFQSKNSLADSAIAEQRFVLSLKIYYTVLEALLTNESDRLSGQMLSNLLNKDDFHKSLLVCSLEVVLTTYGQRCNRNNCEVSLESSSFSFPWLLGVFSLQAYDFYKAIESFVRAEPKLPADVVKHLHLVEIRILEQDAWKEGSPVFDALSEQKETGHVTPPKLASPLSSPMKLQTGAGSSSPYPSCTNGHSRSDLELFLSPVKKGQQSSVTFPSSAQTPSTSSSQHAAASSSNTSAEAGGSPKPHIVPGKSQSLTRFINRVCRLGYSRMSKLCTDLECSEDLQRKIWTCLEHCVTKMPHLLKNRHLDQIIMCCIYGLCKVTEHEILFKVIVSVYRELPHAKQETHKEVYMSDERYDSIIAFYNELFIVNIKSYILQFSPHTASIIMCCIYGLCKVTEHEILFKVIVSVYRELPHAKQETHKEVYMSDERYDSIIAFYNELFIVNIKSYILQFSPHTASKPKLSPMPKPALASPHFSLPGNKNFTISPLKESPFKAPQSPSKMTPGTKLLYSFPEGIGGLGSSEKLKDFRQWVDNKRNGPASAKKRLNMDDVAAPDLTKSRKMML
ncbi:retinoblastoma-associated protein [Plakobranchus ocellatus]|uniref:Retinoblastoma-associated protein n=1 Tax=Plakobranchus ocellatus TaxID=259542 RepID=A0AAV3ZEA5_9GAST|nr:retinoblastoma-associated protein [Plakobranchus ocellatus]